MGLLLGVSVLKVGEFTGLLYRGDGLVRGQFNSGVSGLEVIAVHVYITHILSLLCPMFQCA